jgi:hypothetical protein
MASYLETNALSCTAVILTRRQSRSDWYCSWSGCRVFHIEYEAEEDGRATSRA